MKTARLSLVIILCILSLTAAFAQREAKPDKQVRQVARLLSGSYHNKAQAAADSSYFEIHLQMKPIWKDRKMGEWLYVEQAVASALQRPYRQRVYHVYRRPDGKVVSAVYTLHSPLRFAGAWKQDEPLAGLTPDSLMERTGCEVVLEPAGKGAWKGGTMGTGCESDLRGAKYASSTVTMTGKRLESWDQGFDANGKQVWGATKGGYVFDKVGQLK